jgi:hypothetical protein|tara:strand:- start:22 stop:471 length:450 start_codon:yes stop_codon:yes gene_type:complete
MINVFTEGKRCTDYHSFIDECVVSLFPKDAKYTIYVELKKFVDEGEELGTHAGLCVGDEIESVVSVATHWMFEGEEEIAYAPHEIASNIAHELVHAKQFCRGQINMIDHVWKHNKVVIDCVDLEYMDTPWEVEAYAYEVILTDILWENV